MRNKYAESRAPLRNSSAMLRKIEPEAVFFRTTMPKPNLSTRNRYFVHGSELVAQFVQDSNERKAGIHPLIHFELYLQDPDAHGAASLKSPVDGVWKIRRNGPSNLIKQVVYSCIWEQEEAD